MLEKTMLPEDMRIDWNKICQCGHKAIDHHGQDSRQRCDAGCQVDSNLPEWCRCALTATAVIDVQDALGGEQS